MKLIPSFLLKQLYTRKSLKRNAYGLAFHIKNRLKDATLTEVKGIRVNRKPVELNKVYLLDDEHNKVYAGDINSGKVVDFPLKKSYTVHMETNGSFQEEGGYKVEISFNSSPFGWLDLKFEDKVGATEEEVTHSIPRDTADNFTEKAIDSRRAYITEFAGKRPHYTTHYQFDAHMADGNCENFIGVAQVPLGVAGPILVNGQHAKGEFLVPLATSEGTLVASYNRGIKLLNKCGGVQCTVQDDAMQRAPCFIFVNAAEALAFKGWLQENFESIKKEAESSSSFAKLLNIETYLVGKFAYCRFNYATGDAAGQNMVTLATYMACNWIVQMNPSVQKYMLESNMATDKKPSHINMLQTRGKRVTAEVVLKKEILQQEYGADPEQLDYYKRIGEIGSFMAGSMNNSLHAANALAAIFIATGQDVANVAESCVGVGYSELQPNGDLYVSITLPSLIVATYGGGTGLPTQRECLEIMQCYGAGKVNQFAEIVAGVVLAGELSLGMAVASLEWVSSHEALGRNR